MLESVLTAVLGEIPTWLTSMYSEQERKKIEKKRKRESLSSEIKESSKTISEMEQDFMFQNIGLGGSDVSVKSKFNNLRNETMGNIYEKYDVANPSRKQKNSIVS